MHRTLKATATIQPRTSVYTFTLLLSTIERTKAECIPKPKCSGESPWETRTGFLGCMRYPQPSTMGPPGTYVRVPPFCRVVAPFFCIADVRTGSQATQSDPRLTDQAGPPVCMSVRSGIRWDSCWPMQVQLPAYHSSQARCS